MKSEWIRAERAREVRETARAWSEAGAINAKTLEKVEALYPVDRQPLTGVWRILTFFFVSATVLAIFGAFAAAMDGKSHQLAAASFVLGVILVFVAEGLRSSLRHSRTGADAAAAFWAVLLLLIALPLSTDWGDIPWTLCLFAGSLLWALASWRWGHPTYAVFSACFYFLFLGRLEYGRALWLVTGAALALASARLLDRPSLAPSRRQSASGVLAASLIAVYTAINRFSLDRRTIESVADWNASPSSPSSQAKLLSALATAALPVIVLIWGLRSRRTLVLDLGLAFAGLSLATLRYYVHLAPLWLILTACGSVLVCLAVLLNRFLSRSPGRQYRGFTAEPLFEGEKRQKTAQAVAFAAAFTPQAAQPAAAKRDDFSGGGGKFGGGGSSGTF